MQRSAGQGEIVFAEERDYLEAHLTEGQAAAFLGYKAKTLQKWRVTGSGPAYISVSKRSVKYRRRELIAWANARLRQSTSDTGEGC